MKTENHYTETDLGNISLNPRGEYNPEAFYEYLDTVNMDGGSYMCLAELGTKITGTPPVPGINTEHWQVLTLPGGLTPEYITMHDEVIEKAKQVEVSRAAVELSQSEIEAMQADVTQLHKDTQDSAQNALTSKNQAAGYASAADTSRQAAERAKQDVDAQIPNIDAKLQAALNDIDTTRQSANTSVKKQEELSVQAVKDQTGAYITEQKKLAKQELDQKVNDFGLDVDAIKKQVSDEGAKQVEATRTAGNTAVQEIGTVKSTAVQEVQTEGTAQIEKVSAKGTEQVQAAADTGAQQVQLVKTEGQKQLADVQQAAQEIVADREQIQENKAGIEALKQGKADAIVETASGEIIQIEDSSGLGFEGLRIFGRSTQDGVPSPESQVPIVNVGGKGTVEAKITGKNLFGGDTLANEIVYAGGKKDDAKKTVEWLCGDVGEKKIHSITFKKNTVYTFILYGKCLNNNEVSTNLKIDYTDGSYAYINFSVKGENSHAIASTTIGKTVKCLSFIYSSAGTILEYEKCGVFEGNVTKEEFEEYSNQTLTISTPNGLPGIKVDKDGNYTDSNGQQWIADRIIKKNSVIGIEKNVGVKKITTCNNYLADKKNFYVDIPDMLQKSAGGIKTINSHYSSVTDIWSNTEIRHGYMTNISSLIMRDLRFDNSNNDIAMQDFNNYYKLNPITFVYPLATPAFIPLQQDMRYTIRELHTNYPTTVVSNDESAHMEVSYVADTKNYIDKKFKELNQAIVNTQIALL